MAGKWEKLDGKFPTFFLPEGTWLKKGPYIPGECERGRQKGQRGTLAFRGARIDDQDLDEGGGDNRFVVKPEEQGSF